MVARRPRRGQFRAAHAHFVLDGSPRLYLTARKARDTLIMALESLFSR
jgi:hypothetical protein